MSGRDPFVEGQEAAEDLRRGLEALREDVRAVIREEVAEVGISRTELERLVTDVVRARLAETRPRRDRTPVLLVAGMLVGLLAGALGYHLLAPPSGEGEGSTGTADPAPAATAAGPEAAPAVDPEPAGSGSDTPEVRAARYDSLFDAGPPALEPLMADLATAAAPVTEALRRWRTGERLEGAARRRLHDALVQAAVNRLAGTELALDGLVARGPCGGASCGALRSLWESRGGELGLPPFPGPGETLEATLPMVERLVVLRGLEVAGG